MAVTIRREIEVKGCIPCLSEEVKDAIRQGTSDDAILQLLNGIATCGGGVHFRFCEGGAGRRQGSRRGRSEYQSFVSECMKGKGVKSFGEAPQAMKECAAAWRSKRGQ